MATRRHGIEDESQEQIVPGPVVQLVSGQVTSAH